jgi:guanylate kinase
MSLKKSKSNLPTLSEMSDMPTLIIFTAPSGSGKTTIVRHLLARFQDLAFSVSACTREKRHYEQEGKDYYFLSAEKFKELIAQNAFAEWEEVYENQYYGTLKTEIRRLHTLGKVAIFDIDVKGALKLKEAYPLNCHTIFVQPPSLDELKRRLTTRSTESADSLKKRIEKASYELTFAPLFDRTLINDDLSTALKDAEKIVADILNGQPARH